MHPVLELGADEHKPAFLRIVSAIVRDITRGRLMPGARLPSSRQLASQLVVHRNTVLHAYGELAAEGWIETLPARGTFVAKDLPERSVPKKRSSQCLGFPLRRGPRWEPPPAARYPLLGGLPDLRLVPRTALARAYRRALLSMPKLLGYGDPAGDPLLRATLAQHLRESRGLDRNAEELIVTRGSQQALYLLAQVLLEPGDNVVVESLGYAPAWKALRSTGARLIPVPVGREGIDVDRVAKHFAERRVRAVYLTPHHQYPTTVTLGAASRLKLIESAAKHGVALIEDDYDHEFHFDGRPVLPLAARDEHGVVIHVGTFSKVLAPALRMGWVSAPRPIIESLAAERVHIDRQGDTIVERAIAELLEDGEVRRHTLRMRRVYRAQRDALAAALSLHLGERLTFDLPSGGMAIWAHAAGVDTNAWAARAVEHGVLVQSTGHFAFGRRKARHLRIGYAALDEGRLQQAAKALAKAF